MSGVVLSLCDHTGNMVRPWALAGYRCLCVDLQNGGNREEPNIEWVAANVLAWLPPRTEYVACFAFPPCTDLAVSGARWFREKGLGGLSQALLVVDACRRICEWTSAPWLLENPVSTLSTYWRRPDITFDPCEYAGYWDVPEEEAYTKRTCLWTGGGFVMPTPRGVEPVLGSRMHLIPPGPERANLRSATPRGFAQAVFEANCQAAEEGEG